MMKNIRVAAAAGRRASAIRATAALAAVATAGVADAQAGNIAADMLAVHNAYRSQVGVRPLIWDQDLVDEAREWGETLVRDNRFAHDNAPESLWAGPASASYADMARAWADEKPNYQHQVFNPQSKTISKTGNWGAIGHYTQMVWATNTRVGCAVVRKPDGVGAVSVCRYSPGGNTWGQWAYGDQAPAPVDMPIVQSRALFHFNMVRGEAKVAPLAWKPDLAAQAQAAVDGIGDDGRYAPGAGELYSASAYASPAGSPAPASAPSVRGILHSWTTSGYRSAIVDGKNGGVGCATKAKVIGNQHRRLVVCRFSQA